MKGLLRRALQQAGYLLLNREFMPCGIDLERDISRDADLSDIRTVFDIGANVGNVSLNLSRAFRFAEIHAFEPIEETFLQLERHMGRFPNIKCHRLAFSDTRGVRVVFLQEDCGLNSLNDVINLPDASMDARNEHVQFQTIDQFCQESDIGSIDFLKTDTEGLDVCVLKGAEAMLKGRRIKYVLSEVTFDDANVRNTQFAAVHGYLKGFGFKLRGFYDQSDFGRSSYLTCCNALFRLQ